jgi:hypothetical protein
VTNFRFHIFFLCLLATLAPRWAVSADPITQTTAQEAAKKVNNTGADDSVKGAVTNGMKALDSLNELDIPGALHNGIKAYSQYTNSEKLDKLKDENQDLSNKMGSGGTKPHSSTKYVSPFARLPKNFLYEGEAGKLAERIEKISGVSRGELLNKVISAETRSKSVPDSQWLSWTVKTTGEFAESMPNEGFREILLKANRLAIRLFENGTAKSVIAKFQGGKEEDKKTAIAVLKINLDMAPPTSVGANKEIQKSDSPNSHPVEMLAANSPLPANSDSGKKGTTSTGGIHQLESRNEFLDNLIHTAVVPKDLSQHSIFDIVSEKIRRVSARQGFAGRK